MADNEIEQTGTEQPTDVGLGVSSLLSSLSSTANTTESTTIDACPTSAVPWPAPSGPTISHGAAAGIGIGSAVVGAAVALLAGFVYVRNNRGNSKKSDAGMLRRQIQDSRFDDPETAHDYLPLPVSFNSFKAKLEGLQTDIKDCVDNSFRRKVALDHDAESRFQALAGNPIGAQEWTTRLTDDRQRRLVTRQLIAMILFGWIDTSSNHDVGLLPPSVKDVHQRLLAEGVLGQSDAGTRDKLLGLWREISGHLLQQLPDQTTLGVASSQLASVLEPLRPKQTESYLAALDSLVTNTAILGMDLYKHPCRWETVWESGPGSAKEGVVVFPGLVFILHDSSRRQVRSVKTEG